MRDKAIGLSEAKAGDLAADIGAGTGFVSEGLLEKGVRVIAVDGSSEMLQVASRKLGGKPIEFRLGKAEEIPIEDGCVDFAFANMLLHHADDPKAVISEMGRIVKEGGRVVITDLDEHDSVFLRTEHHDRWMGFNRDAVREWLTQAGMQDATVESLDESCCATSSTGEQADVGIFVAMATKPVHKLIK